MSTTVHWPELAFPPINLHNMPKQVNITFYRTGDATTIYVETEPKKNPAREQRAPRQTQIQAEIRKLLNR